MIKTLLTIICAVLSMTAYAQHTFSIVAIDSATGEIGSAGATCLTSADCGGCGGAIIISDLIAGKGAMNAQAQICLPNVNLNLGIAEINNGVSAQDVLSDVLDGDLCSSGGTSDRQYGIITLGEGGAIEVAAYTGKSALDYAAHITGPNYSIQGNILIGPEVLSGMEEGFLNTEGTLAEKLMGAMQGANIPGADSRCLSAGISSRSSYLRLMPLEGENDANFMELIVPNTINNVDPIDSLQSLFTERLGIINSVSFVERASTLKILPNPANAQITIQHLQNYFKNGTIYFYSNQGILLQQNQLAGNPIDINRIPSGVVVYRVFNTEGSKVTSGKFIIQR